MAVSDFTRRVLDRIEPPEVTIRKPPADFTVRVLQSVGIEPVRTQAERIEETERIAEEARRKAERMESIAGLAVGTVREIPGILKEIGQSIARNIASAGVTISKALGGAEKVAWEDFPKVFQPTARAIFTAEPIKPIEQRIAEAELKIKDFGLELKVEGVQSKLGRAIERNALPLAFAGIMGSVGIDLTPFGGLEKNAIKALVKTKT
ncbi:unnamed protein product, partial [marine sediment metagenome]